MNGSVPDAIRALLDGQQVRYRLVRHGPTYTSEESARARGEPLGVGGKALVVKTDDTFRLLVLSAARTADWSAVKRHFGCKRVRLADRTELARLTGLEPGAVPPFGWPVLPLDLYADPSALANPVIAFNAGSLTDSVVLAVEDYVRAARPEVVPFAAT
jgi:Ala-tRNA(Pro) deacylase